MRNSFLPVLMMVAVCAVAFWLIKSGPLPGSTGPDIFPGIFRLPTGNKLLVNSLTTVVCETTVAKETVEDTRFGCEPDAWERVMLSALDDGPYTRSVIRAMAEQLTIAGTAAIIATNQEMPAPFPVDRVIAVSSSGQLPAKLGDASSATVTLQMYQPRFPADHPAAQLQPIGGIRGGSLVLEHHNHLSDGATVQSWSQWYATVGRSLAASALAHWAEEGISPYPWTDLKMVAWPESAPLPPQHPVIRWSAPVRFELVCGWIGEIRGKTTIAAEGREQSSFEPLEKLLKKGAWEEISATDPTWRLWKREHEGAVQWFASRETTVGWDLTHWQERPEPAGVHDNWLDAAENGEAAARHQIRRYALSSALPDDQQKRAAAILRKDPDAADLAVLGHLPGASEKAVADAVYFIRGISASAPKHPLTIVLIDKGQSVPLNGRPLLVTTGSELILVAVRADGHGEAWSRPRADGSPVSHATSKADDATQTLSLRLAQGEIVVQNQTLSLR